ncbi:hypothetical protein [Paenibacillus glycanilyticus]|uniref:hypothetical protein n=1 Tax=Paenibacillus glycanilyticus TaxID=126569 RepID=UPI00190FC9BD|nr:hypothetical protein [Paenibacillus glycanilyticus]
MMTIIVCLGVIVIFGALAITAVVKRSSGDWSKTNASVILNFSAVVIVLAFVFLLREANNKDGGLIP